MLFSLYGHLHTFPSAETHKIKQHQRHKCQPECHMSMVTTRNQKRGMERISLRASRLSQPCRYLSHQSRSGFLSSERNRLFWVKDTCLRQLSHHPRGINTALIKLSFCTAWANAVTVVLGVAGSCRLQMKPGNLSNGTQGFLGFINPSVTPPVTSQKGEGTLHNMSFLDFHGLRKPVLEVGSSTCPVCPTHHLSSLALSHMPVPIKDCMKEGV